MKKYSSPWRSWQCSWMLQNVSWSRVRCSTRDGNTYDSGLKRRYSGCFCWFMRCLVDKSSKCLNPFGCRRNSQFAWPKNHGGRARSKVARNHDWGGENSPLAWAHGTRSDGRSCAVESSQWIPTAFLLMMMHGSGRSCHANCLQELLMSISWTQVRMRTRCKNDPNQGSRALTQIGRIEANVASSFCSILQDLPDLHTFLPPQIQHLQNFALYQI